MSSMLSNVELKRKELVKKMIDFESILTRQVAAMGPAARMGTQVAVFGIQLYSKRLPRIAVGKAFDEAKDRITRERDALRDALKRR